MAIEFGRSEHISRGKGGNAVRSGAYVIREKLFDERLGVTYRFKNDGTLQYAVVLLPDGADSKFLDPATLLNEMERVEVRRDAQVARHIVVALDAESSLSERIEMANGFARQIFVNKGLPVLVGVHFPHDGGNPHAHLIGATRSLDAEGFSPRKVRDTPFARIFGRPVVLESERIGELWRDFQNSWFSKNGKVYVVDPVAPFPQEHIGVKRWRHPNDPRITANDKIRQLNSTIARDPAAVVKYIRAQERPFTPRDLGRFLTKHIADPHVRETAQAEVLDKIQKLRVAALEKAAMAAQVPSGWRASFIEDIAFEISADYRNLIKKAARLRERVAVVEKKRNYIDSHTAEARSGLAQRQVRMGVVRRVLDRAGVWTDPELKMWTGMQKGTEWAHDQRWSIRLKTAMDRLDAVSLLIAEKLNELRPVAERELARRQRAERNARVALADLEKQENLRLRAARPRL